MTAEQNRKQIKQRARRLASRYHIAMNVAYSVARGEIGLAEAIRRNTEQHRANLIESKHGLSRSDAVQVARGNMALDEVLFRKGLKAHLDEHADRSILSWSQENEAPIQLYLHGCRQESARVVEQDLYSVLLEGVEERVSKLQIIAAQKAGGHFDVREDPEKRVPVDPIDRPEDRFRLASKHLFSLHSKKTTARFELFEGLSVSGVLGWIGRYELGVEDSKGREIVIFRHAIAAFQED